MGINFSDLPPKAQEQVKIKYAIEEARRRQKTHAKNLAPKEKKEKRTKKLGNQETIFNGIKFDSKREADRYAELLLLQKCGEISDLQRQVVFELIPKQIKADGTAERAVKYIADFVYLDSDGKKVVEDAKGFRDPSSAAYKVFALKRKMMLYFHGIEIQEV